VLGCLGAVTLIAIVIVVWVKVKGKKTVPVQELGSIDPQVP
jgi:hypothetical protein